MFLDSIPKPKKPDTVEVDSTGKVVFLNDLVLKVVSDREFYVMEEFLISVQGKLIAVPAYYKTDLASVPRLPIVYLLVGAVGHKAAVLHDYLYGSGIFERAECDEIYYQALLVSGVSRFKALLMFAGVRAGGASRYNDEARTEYLIREEERLRGLVE